LCLIKYKDNFIFNFVGPEAPMCLITSNPIQHFLLINLKAEFRGLLSQNTEPEQPWTHCDAKTEDTRSQKHRMTEFHDVFSG
jgi:hypothetical protein